MRASLINFQYLFLAWLGGGWGVRVGGGGGGRAGNINIIPMGALHFRSFLAFPMRALLFLCGPCFSYGGLGINFQYLFLAWLGLAWLGLAGVGGEHEHHQHHCYEGLAFPMKAVHFL